MSTNPDFKYLWNKQEIAVPDIKELFTKTNRFRRRHLGKLILTLILFTGTILFIGNIWFTYEPRMMSTKIGIILVIVAMLSFATVYTGQVPFLKKVDNSCNLQLCLEQLLALKKKQHFLYTTMMSIYFLLLSLGMTLYLIEPLSQMSLLWKIICCTATFLWIAFNWFVVRPKNIRKQQQKIDTLIEEYKTIQSQLKES